jgi:hypothetical protein
MHLFFYYYFNFSCDLNYSEQIFILKKRIKTNFQDEYFDQKRLVRVYS